MVEDPGAPEGIGRSEQRPHVGSGSDRAEATAHVKGVDVDLVGLMRQEASEDGAYETAPTRSGRTHDSEVSIPERLPVVGPLGLLTRKIDQHEGDGVRRSVTWRLRARFPQVIQRQGVRQSR